LALMELPRGFTPMELAGGFGLGLTEVPHTIEESYRRQIATLSTATRQLLLVAAAEPVGDPVIVWRAVDQLGIGIEGATSRKAAGLVHFASRVRFRHPLLRSAIYHVASLEERRATHQALAEVTDAVADPDRRAWHLAQAAAGPDEEVAAELERSASRAKSRGGFAAAGAFFERASELTRTRCGAVSGHSPRHSPGTRQACPSRRSVCCRWLTQALWGSSSAHRRTCCVAA
jgi:hypothetical protein